MAMAQQMMNQPGGVAGQATPAARRAGSAAAAAGAIPETVGPADAAKALGVVRSGRDRQPRSRRSERQANRHAVAHHEDARSPSSCSSPSRRRDRPPVRAQTSGRRRSRPHAQKFNCPACGAEAQLESGEAGAGLPVLRRRVAGDAPGPRRRHRHRRARSGGGAAQHSRFGARLAGRRRSPSAARAARRSRSSTPTRSAAAATSADPRRWCRTKRSRTRSGPSRCCR